MRLAYFSPLNPAPSGISDYSLELLPHLAAHADITLVVDGYTPTDPALKSLRVLDDKNYDARAFDLALYQMGNSPAHAYIYRRALNEPGVIVLHELVLHHLVAWLTINHGDTAGYIAAMGDAYGEDGARLAQREVLGHDALNRFDYPLSERVLQNARGVIAHSRYVTDAVKRIAPRIPVAQIPHEMPDIPLLAQNEARARLNLPQNVPLVGTFGNLGPTKRTTILLDAFRAVHQKFPDARLVLVGAASPNFDLDGLVNVFDLRETVQLIGHVPFDAFHTYMAAMDVCINLRYPTAGETSGAVLRSMALAKPVIVSRIGWFAELPDDTVAKIDMDDQEVALLRTVLTRLLQDNSLRAAMGANARQYVLDHCAVETAAQSYADFLQAVAHGNATVRVFEPPRAPNTTRVREPGHAVASEQRKPIANALASNTPDASDWRAALVRAYVDLGLEANDAVLQDIARDIVALGLHSA